MKTIETKRLILRSWEQSDLDDFYSYASVPGVGEMAGWQHHTDIEISKEILSVFIEKDDTYAIVLRENGKVIGSLGIHNRTPDKDYSASCQRELGYVLSRDYWGLGIMPEAAKAAIRYVFECMNVDVLWCCHFDFNSQSRRVIEKCGFRFYSSGTYDAAPLGKSFNDKHYIMTREDYKKSAVAY